MTGFKNSFHLANYATEYRSYFSCQVCSSEQVTFGLNALLGLPNFKPERDDAGGIGFADDLDARYRAGLNASHAASKKAASADGRALAACVTDTHKNGLTAPCRDGTG